MKEFTNAQLLQLYTAGVSVETLASVAGIKEQRIKTILRLEKYRAEREVEIAKANILAIDTLNLIYAKINANWVKDDLLEFLEPRIREFRKLRNGI